MFGLVETSAIAPVTYPLQSWPRSYEAELLEFSVSVGNTNVTSVRPDLLMDGPVRAFSLARCSLVTPGGQLFAEGH